MEEVRCKMDKGDKVVSVTNFPLVSSFGIIIKALA
jgi:hypothetical protein